MNFSLYNAKFLKKNQENISLNGHTGNDEYRTSESQILPHFADGPIFHGQIFHGPVFHNGPDSRKRS